jgi:hypothetical protein
VYDIAYTEEIDGIKRSEKIKGCINELIINEEAKELYERLQAKAKKFLELESSLDEIMIEIKKLINEEWKKRVNGVGSYVLIIR